MGALLDRDWKSGKISVFYEWDGETPVSIQGPLVRADWYDAGEGICGDYDPEDPDDIPLLRFDIYIKKDGEWEPVEDASYCTRIPLDLVNENRVALVEKLYVIYKAYEDVLSSDPDASVKKLGEYLSWISV